MSNIDRSSSWESVRAANDADEKKVRETTQEATEVLASNQNVVVDGSKTTEEDGSRDSSDVRGVTRHTTSAGRRQVRWLGKSW